MNTLPTEEWSPGPKPAATNSSTPDDPANYEASRAAMLPPPKLAPPKSRYGFLTPFIYWLLKATGLLNKVVAMYNNSDAIRIGRVAAWGLSQTKKRNSACGRNISLCRDNLLLAHYWSYGSYIRSGKVQLVIPEAFHNLWQNTAEVDDLIWQITHTDDRLTKEALILQCVTAMEKALAKARNLPPFTLDDQHFYEIFM